MAAAHEWLGILLLCCFTCDGIYALQTYYLEELCKYSRYNVMEFQSTSKGLDSSAIFKTTRNKYKTNSICSVLLKAPADHRIAIAVREIDLRLECIDNLTVTCVCGGQQEKEFCMDYRNSNESLVIDACELWNVTFRTASSPYGTFSGFQFTVTAYRYQGSFSPFEYKCDNDRFISNALVCDGHNHCGDRSDQDNCNDGEKSSLNSTSSLFLNKVTFLQMFLLLFLSRCFGSLLL